MLIVYTGNGKGKTCACIGQAIRALGQGLRVYVAQFIKADAGTGEQRFLHQVLGERFLAGGLGFFSQPAHKADHRQKARETCLWCLAALPKSDMLVADEALYALDYGLLLQREIMELIRLARQLHVHLVLSGRGLPGWIADEADLITEMHPVKHPADRGFPARLGIEF